MAMMATGQNPMGYPLRQYDQGYQGVHPGDFAHKYNNNPVETASKLPPDPNSIRNWSELHEGTIHSEETARSSSHPHEMHSNAPQPNEMPADLEEGRLSQKVLIDDAWKHPRTQRET